MPVARLLAALAAALLLGAAAAPAGAGPATRTYALPPDAANPEGVAADPRTKAFYVTERTGGTVFRGLRGQDGPLEAFLPGGEDGRTAATGIKVDDRRGLLVVAGAETGAVFV